MTERDAVGPHSFSIPHPVKTPRPSHSFCPPVNPPRTHHTVPVPPSPWCMEWRIQQVLYLFIIVYYESINNLNNNKQVVFYCGRIKKGEDQEYVTYWNYDVQAEHHVPLRKMMEILI